MKSKFLVQRFFEGSAVMFEGALGKLVAECPLIVGGTRVYICLK